MAFHGHFSDQRGTVLSFRSQKVLLRSQHLYQCLSYRVPHLHTSMDLCHTDILIRDVVYTYSVIKYISCTVRSVGVCYFIKQPYKILQLLIYRQNFKRLAEESWEFNFRQLLLQLIFVKTNFPFFEFMIFTSRFFLTKQIQYSKLDYLERSIKHL